jgi:hypothetical protein
MHGNCCILWVSFIADAAPDAEVKVERCSTFCSVRMGNVPQPPADFSGPFNVIGLCAWGCRDNKVGPAAAVIALLANAALYRLVKLE